MITFAAYLSLCKADRIEQDNYETKYTQPGYNCPLMEPDAKKLEKIIRASGLSLIRLSEKDNSGH
jgi:hypothetical protein